MALGEVLVEKCARSWFVMGALSFQLEVVVPVVTTTGSIREHPLYPLLFDTQMSSCCRCENYDFANYSRFGIGCNRGPLSRGGTGYSDMYSPAVAAELEDIATIDPKLLLFFHNVAWEHPVKPHSTSNITIPLIQYIRDGHREAVKEVGDMMNAWTALRGQIDQPRFEGVQARFLQQQNDAAVFASIIIDYYHNVSGL